MISTPPDIYDFDVWVTPMARYLAIGYLNTLPMNIEYPEEDFIQDPDPYNYLATPTYLFEFKQKGSLVVKQFEDQGHRVRLKEIAMPRFGENQWMKTNRIKKGV